MSDRLDFNACWDECMKNIHLPSGVIATNKYEIKEIAEVFFNLGSNYKNRDKEIDQLKSENESIRSQLLAQCKISNELLDEKDQLKAQIEKMKNCYNCKYANRQYGSCNLINDLVGLGSKCGKWEMMK